MPYSRGSEEFYRGGNSSYNDDALALMRQAQARNLEQVNQIGNLNAQGIREPAGILAEAFANAPTNAMKGAEFRQKSDRNATAQAEENLNLGAHERMDAWNQTSDPLEAMSDNGSTKNGARISSPNPHQQTMEQKAWKAGLSRQSSAATSENAKARMDEYSTNYGLGNSEEGTPRINQALSAQYGRDGLSNRATQSGIDMNSASIGQMSATSNRQKLEDQATVNAYYQTKGTTPPRVGTPEGNAALADAMAGNKVKSSQEAADLAFSSKPENAPTMKKMNDLNEKMASLTQLKESLDSYSATSDNPFSDRESKDAAIRKFNSVASQHSLPKSGGFGGDITPTLTHNQMKRSIEMLTSDVEAQISDIESSKGAGGTNINNLLAQHKQALRVKYRETAVDKIRALANPPGTNSNDIQPASGNVPQNNPRSKFGGAQR